MFKSFRVFGASAVLIVATCTPAMAQACGVTAHADVAGKIAAGHSWGKHSAEFKSGTVMAGLAMPTTPKVTTVTEFKSHILAVMGSATNKALTGGRKAWWWAATGTIVIHDPANADCGTAFRPVLGKPYYDQQK